MVTVGRGEKVSFMQKIEGICKKPPIVSIVNPYGKIIEKGSASLVSRSNSEFSETYLYKFFCPVDSTTGTWKQVWECIVKTKNGKDKEIRIEKDFEVIEPYLEEAESRAQQSLAIQGTPYRAFIRFEVEPEEISLKVLDGVNPSLENKKSIVFSVDRKEDLNIRKDPQFSEGCFAWKDVPLSGKVGQYFLVLWYFRPTFSSPTYTHYEVVVYTTPKIFKKIVELRQLIDKYQKKFGSVRAYEDAELYEYLEKGVGYINATHPFTNFTLEGLPKEFDFVHILASAWYALNAQYLLEGDSSFEYSGVSTSISVDRTGYVESELERLKSYLDDQLSKLKLNYSRRKFSGVVAGRGAVPIGKSIVIGQWKIPNVTSS